LISFGCAAAVPVGIDSFDSRIHTAEDIERVVGFHPIGVLLDTDEFSDEVAEEYYFRLAAGIDNAVRNAGARSFLFTSPSRGAGTSTVVKRLSEELRGLNLRTRTIRAGGSRARLTVARDCGWKEMPRLPIQGGELYKTQVLGTMSC
jgi:hypothetical protein